MVSGDLTLQNKTRSVELFDIKGPASGWNPRDGGVVNVDYDPVPAHETRPDKLLTVEVETE